jgi:hypothetical protein
VSDSSDDVSSTKLSATDSTSLLGEPGVSLVNPQPPQFSSAELSAFLTLIRLDMGTKVASSVAKCSISCISLYMDDKLDVSNLRLSRSKIDYAIARASETAFQFDSFRI